MCLLGPGLASAERRKFSPVQMSQTDRLFDSNDSFAEGRQTELVVIRTLERAGLIVTGTKANQPHYDIVIIDPVQDKEFIAQIKSSKHRKPYITCRNF